VQTFLPFPDFAASAKVLDVQRLGKQRVENLQILSALIFPSYGWQHHPATGIWRGHARALWLYHNAICNEWTRRGYKDTCKDKFFNLLEGRTFLSLEMPPIVGHEPFHASHRAALLHKNFAHYSQFGWTETPKLEYIWKL
jgi:hypothetical protein